MIQRKSNNYLDYYSDVETVSIKYVPMKVRYMGEVLDNIGVMKT